jgi:hypothetical protein
LISDQIKHHILDIKNLSSDEQRRALIDYMKLQIKNLSEISQNIVIDSVFWAQRQREELLQE